ncbi:MAG: hypothetical protein OXI96_03955 [Acidimicrobiaceae bacterium]|nr:hypothetical protein [Acidimicrobiaceae bacterium]
MNPCETHNWQTPAKEHDDIPPEVSSNELAAILNYLGLGVRALPLVTREVHINSMLLSTPCRG